MRITADDWLERYAAALGIERPSGGEVDALLEMAGIAAHASERTAAPLSCWLAARSGVEPGRALELARELAAGAETTSGERHLPEHEEISNGRHPDADA